MYDTVSKPIIATIAIQTFMAGISNAVSNEAVCLHQAQTDIADYAEQSLALFGKKCLVISSICELEAECSEPDWDGYKAEPISPRAILSAKEFVKVLPNDMPMPEVSVEPDGSISLDWIKSTHCLFSVSIGTADRLAFAWMDGTDRGHGVARFDSVSIPQKILQGINSVA